MTTNKEFIYDISVANEYTKFWNNSNETQLLGYNYIIEKIGDIEDKNVLDYGCGTGEFTKILSKRGAQVTGVDISNDMLEIAKQNDVLSSYHTTTSLPVDLRFDIIIINYVLCVIDSKEKIRDILCGLTKKLSLGGKIFIQNANRDEANGMDYKSFSLIKKKILSDGDEMFALLKGVELGKDLIVKDYFHSLHTYKEICNETNLSIKVTRIFEEIDKKPPLYIIEASKKQKTSLSSEQRKKLKSCITFQEMAEIALYTIKEVGGKCIQICGPITTGGKDDVRLNIETIKKEIENSSLIKNTFDQMEYFEEFERIINKSVQYDNRILTEFYETIFSSGLILECHFLSGRHSSKGAVREHDMAKKLGIKIVYL